MADVEESQCTFSRIQLPLNIGGQWRVITEEVFGVESMVNGGDMNFAPSAQLFRKSLTRGYPSVGPREGPFREAPPNVGFETTGVVVRGAEGLEEIATS